MVLQTRIRIVDALVERRDDVALQPRSMHGRRVVFGQESSHGALHAVARELLWVVPTLALDERQSVECPVVLNGLLRLAVGPAERRRIAVHAVGNRLVHRDARECLRGVVVRLAVHLVSVVAVRGDHHVLAAVALEVAEAGVLGHLRSLRDTVFQRLHERRAVLLGPLVVLFIHLVRVALPAVEDALQLALAVEGVDEVAIDGPGAEVPRATELVHEVGLVSIEEVDALGQQPDELRLHLSEGEVPAPVQIRHSVYLGVPKRFPVVFFVPGNDVPVQPTVVTLSLPTRVVHAGADGIELDRPPHHLPGDATKAAEEVEDHAPVVFLRVVGTRAFLVVAGVEVAVVDAVLHEVRVGFTGVAGRSAVLLYGFLHPVTEPAREREGGDDATDLVLRVIIFVVAVRGVMPVSHDAVPNHQQVGADSHKYVAFDVDVCHNPIYSVSSVDSAASTASAEEYGTPPTRYCVYFLPSAVRWIRAVTRGSVVIVHLYRFELLKLLAQFFFRLLNVHTFEGGECLPGGNEVVFPHAGCFPLHRVLE